MLRIARSLIGIALRPYLTVSAVTRIVPIYTATSASAARPRFRTSASRKFSMRWLNSASCDSPASPVNGHERPEIIMAGKPARGTEKAQPSNAGGDFARPGRDDHRVFRFGDDNPQSYGFWRSFAFRYPAITFVGIGLVGGIGLCGTLYSTVKLHQAYKARRGVGLLQGTEDALTGLVRPGGRLARQEVPTTASVLDQTSSANVVGQAREYRPLPFSPAVKKDPAVTDPHGVKEQRGRVGVGDELRARQIPVPVPMPRVASMVEDAKRERNLRALSGEHEDRLDEAWAMDNLGVPQLHASVVDLRTEVQGLRHQLETQGQQLREVAQLLREAQDNRRRHDNNGRPPRDDDDDGDDDTPRPPAPQAQNGTGSIPSANNLDLTGPRLASTWRINNVEPEETRGLGRAPSAPAPAPAPAPVPGSSPSSTAQPPHPQVAANEPPSDMIFSMDDITAAIRRMERANEAGSSPSSQEVGDIMRNLAHLYPKYTATQAYETFDNVRHGGQLPTPPSPDASKPKKKPITKKTEPGREILAVDTNRDDTPDTRDDQTVAKRDSDSEPTSPTSSCASWDTIGMSEGCTTPPASIGGESWQSMNTVDEKATFQSLLTEGEGVKGKESEDVIESEKLTSTLAQEKGKGKGKANVEEEVENENVVIDKIWNDVDSDFEIETPSGPGSSNWAGKMNSQSYDEAQSETVRRNAGSRSQSRIKRTAKESSSEYVADSPQALDVDPHIKFPFFVLAEDLYEPVTARRQAVRVQIRMPIDNDDISRRVPRTDIQTRVEIWGGGGEITHVRISETVWVCERREGYYILLKELDPWA